MAQCTSLAREEGNVSFGNSSFFLESHLLGGLQLNNKKGDNNIVALGGGLTLRSMSIGVSVDVGGYNTKNIFHPSLDLPVDLHHNTKNPEISDSDSDDMDSLTPQPTLPLNSEIDNNNKVTSRTQDASKELELEDLITNNEVCNLSSPVHQSGSYPRSLKECGGQDTNGVKPIPRSKSTPVMPSTNDGRRRVIFPSFHHGKPQDNQNELKLNPINKDIRCSFPPPPRRKKSFDKSIIDSAFNDSLNLNYFHSTENRLSTVTQDEDEISQNSGPCKSSPTSIVASNELLDLKNPVPSKNFASILKKPRYTLKNSSEILRKTHNSRISPPPKMASLPSDDTLSFESTQGTFRTNSPSSHHFFQQNSKTATDDPFRRRNSEKCLASGNILSESKDSLDNVSSPPTSQKTIKFDPRVWVIEFTRSKDEQIWFTSVELNKFKAEAIRRIQQRDMKMMSSGTGRIINVRSSGNAGKAAFTNPALSTDEEDDEDEASKSKLSPSSMSFISANNTETFQKILLSEIKSVLVVDSHDLFLKLITKGIMMMLPHVSVTTAHSANEAFERIFDAREKSPLSDGGCTHGFDLIIIEERLTLSRRIHPSQSSSNSMEQGSPDHKIPESGSGFINNIKCEESNMLNTWKMSNWWRSSHPRFAMLIGMSAYLDQDTPKMKRGGADMMWGKPPPPLNSTMRRAILRLLLKKRDRRDIHISNN